MPEGMQWCSYFCVASTYFNRGGKNLCRRPKILSIWTYKEFFFLDSLLRKSLMASAKQFSVSLSLNYLAFKFGWCVTHSFCSYGTPSRANRKNINQPTNQQTKHYSADSAASITTESNENKTLNVREPTTGGDAVVNGPVGYHLALIMP